MKVKKILFPVLIMLIAKTILSQTVVTGKVVDGQNSKPLGGVQIFLKSDWNKGAVSDEKGRFEITIPSKNVVLIFKLLGYKRKEVDFGKEGVTPELGTVSLEKQIYSIDEITVTAGLVKDKNSPVSITEITGHKIKTRLSDNPLPVILNSDPSVFAVRAGGGSGDAVLSMRGFKQENVALLLNGIPINGEENGLVYWSNWLGLSNAASGIQIQKGSGFVNLASNAVGGSINIITENAQNKKGGTAGIQTTSYGNNEYSLTYGSGILNNGWSFLFSGSIFKGKGYIEATPVKGFSYFFTASKEFGKKNSLVFTLLGAPQYHEQRNLKLSFSEVNRYGYLFNKDWGGLDGKQKNASANFYHKPFFIVNHNLSLNKSKHLSNTIYFSYGTGGGRWSESFGYNPSLFSYRTASNRIDWETIYNNNANNDGKYILENGDTVSGYSLNVGTDFLASHVETGFLSNYQQKTGKHFTWTSGLHYRYFKSFLREKITDLMGGAFYIEDYAWSLAGVAGRNQIKNVGDIIKVNNRSVINGVNLYSRMEFKNKTVNAFLSLKANNTQYSRIDNYNYIENTHSKKVSRYGFDVRSGISYMPFQNHKIYLNGAFISRTPYFKYVFGNFTNVPVQNLENEIFETVEAGYSFSCELFYANVTAYYTLRQNVSMLTNEYVQLEDNTQSRTMINGLNALHKGVEVTADWTLSPVLKIGGMASFNDYRWQNDVSARLINNDNVVIDTVNIYVKGLHVGGTAQQKLGLHATVLFFKNWNLSAGLLHYGKLFADFDPLNRNLEGSYPDAFEFPAYNIVNLYLNIPLKIFSEYASLQLNVNNLLNEHYILTGEDGEKHNLETFRGFWSFGRTASLSFKVYF